MFLLWTFNYKVRFAHLGTSGITFPLDNTQPAYYNTHNLDFKSELAASW